MYSINTVAGPVAGLGYMAVNKSNVPAHTFKWELGDNINQ